MNVLCTKLTARKTVAGTKDRIQGYKEVTERGITFLIK
jgi:hypothetical protein